MDIQKVLRLLSASSLLVSGFLVTACGPSTVSVQQLTGSPVAAPEVPKQKDVTASPVDLPTSQEGLQDRLQTVLLDPANEIPQDAARNAYAYFQSNASAIRNKKYITIVDFTASSRTKRMHLVNVQTGAVDRYLVAHGKNSGFDYATTFSNRSGSNMSSIGFYLTGSEYQGGHGISMHLLGQESTNSNAYSRAIVVHGASYVTDDIAASQPRLGRSLGCPAVDLKYISSVVHRLEEGSLYYIYYAKSAFQLEDLVGGFARPDFLGVQIPGEEEDETLNSGAQLEQ